MKHLSYLLSCVPALALALCLASCDDDNTGDLRLDGDTRITALSLDGFEAEIDDAARTVTVGIPCDHDASAMTLTALRLSEGATADIAVGEKVNCTAPRHIRVSNGDLFNEYIMTVAHDDVRFLTFTIDGKYEGTIDNTARTINVFVPLEADVTAMLATFTTNEGATVTPASSSVLDFSQPVEFTATYRTATVTYTVTVVKDDMSQEPKAFIGNAASVDALGDEAREAAMWMIANIPNSSYVSIQQVIDGTVKLADYKMIWCHFDWTDWPSFMWDSRDIFNDYYIKGGNFLASRDGARYINDVWRITLDQQSPNNMFGGDSAETLADDLGFSIAGFESHPIYEGLPADGSHINMVSAGCTNTNRTLQWVVDWTPYGDMAGWQTRTGATALAYDHQGDTNHVTIAEIAPREVLNGYMSGTVITVGTPAFEWYQANGTNSYRPVMEQFTKNAINYLCK